MSVTYKGDQNRYLQLDNEIINKNLLTNNWNIIYNEILKDYSTFPP